MNSIKIKLLKNILDSEKIVFLENHIIQVPGTVFDKNTNELLSQIFSVLGGSGDAVFLNQLKFDLKIDRFLFLYDEAYHFNRYRLATLKMDIYSIFTFQWVETYRKLCRNYEKDCLKGGMQERVWNGPAIAQRCFGVSEEPGDLSGNGASGWKMVAYWDAQYDLISRLMGYKIVRIPLYENIMLQGSLKKIDQLLVNPSPETKQAIANWFLRKMQF